MSPDKPQIDISVWSAFTRKITGIFLAAGLLVGGLLTGASIWKQKSQWKESLVLRGKTLARSLGRAAFVPMVLEDTAALDTLAEGFMEEPDVVYVAFYTPQGKSLSLRPRGMDLPLGEDLSSLSQGLSERHILSPARVRLWDLVLPLRYGSSQGNATAGSELSGFVRVGLTEERIDQEIRSAALNNILLCLGVMTVVFMARALLIDRMTRQMRRFLEQVQRTVELQRSNKELEAFSYSVSHDLRTPLRAIDGFSHALLEDYGNSLDAQAKDYITRVRAGCQRMGQLIDDLLALSRVIRQEMKRERVDLSATAQSVATTLAQAEPDRSVEFTVQEGIAAAGDSGLLRIVLENLLGNAWKFTRKKSDARIEFGVAEKDGRGVFFVRDNGAGFDMKYADKLFGAFQRLHDASDFPGTGIGLATVQRVIHRHGGRIWAESAVGQGTTFYFTLKEDA